MKHKNHTNIKVDEAKKIIEQIETAEKIEATPTNYKAEVEEWKNHYLRTLADYKNLERRFEQERSRMKDIAKKEMIERMLPILDTLDQAEVFNTDPGLRVVGKTFRQSLAELGVQEIELLGNEFDPFYAEAVEAVVGKQDNVIVEVLQKAYGLNSSIVRPGKVKVSKLVPVAQ